MISHFEITAGGPRQRRTEIKPNVIDRIASAISPSWALRRQIARQRLERIGQLQQNFIRGFEAVESDRTRYGMNFTGADTNSFIKDGSESLRQHVRYMEFQTGFVSGPISRLVNNIVGSGFQFQARVKGSSLSVADSTAEKINNQIEGACKRWFKQSDKRLMWNFGTMTRIVQGALTRDNGVLVVGRKSNRNGRIIPYCQDLYEVDRLRTPVGEITNPKIINGVEYDQEGVPVRYYVLKRHPGDCISGIGLKADDFEEIPAFFPNGSRKVMHLFSPIRPEQLFGFSKFASALKDLQDIDRTREAEILALLEDACLFGSVKTPSPMQFQQGQTAQTAVTDSHGRPVHEFSPNKWYYLPPGSEIDVHSPQRPNDGLADFLNFLSAGPANALDIPPEVLSQNWQGMNYSNARTVLLQFYLVCRISQKFLMDYYCEPTYECVLNDLIAFGKVQAPKFITNRDDYMAHAWIPPGWQWVDPLKEAQANTEELESNSESLPRIWASKGEDWEEQLEIQARVLAKKKELEAKYEVQFPGKTTSTPTDTADEPDNQPRDLRVIK